MFIPALVLACIFTFFALLFCASWRIIQNHWIKRTPPTIPIKDEYYPVSTKVDKAYWNPAIPLVESNNDFFCHNKLSVIYLRK